MNRFLFVFNTSPVKLSAIVLALGLLTGCGNQNTPLDADTRKLIDSLTVVGIRQARSEIDSSCALQRRERMPILIDSLKKRRLQEIEEKLKSIPR